MRSVSESDHYGMRSTSESDHYWSIDLYLLRSLLDHCEIWSLIRWLQFMPWWWRLDGGQTDCRAIKVCSMHSKLHFTTISRSPNYALCDLVYLPVHQPILVSCSVLVGCLQLRSLFSPCVSFIFLNLQFVAHVKCAVCLCPTTNWRWIQCIQWTLTATANLFRRASELGWYHNLFDTLRYQTCVRYSMPDTCVPSLIYIR